MPQIKEGIVVANKMPKTVVVKVSSRLKHPFYKKIIRSTKKFKAHDPSNTKIGQKVTIIETRPIAKDVHFKIMKESK